jgi:hypothetical protein
MIRCGILEEPDAAMARFRGGLNREIQDILDYKEYADMTQLFEFDCKAEREVQGRRSRTYSNTFAGRNSSSSSSPALPAPSTPTPCEKTATPAGATPATGATPTTGRTRDITCFRCSGRGHVARNCPTSAHYSFVKMVSTLQLVIQKNLNILCLPLTMQLRRTYMSIRGMPIGMRVLLSSVFLVHSRPSREESATHSDPYEGCCAGAVDSHHHRQRQLQQFGEYYAGREVVFIHS